MTNEEIEAVAYKDFLEIRGRVEIAKDKFVQRVRCTPPGFWALHSLQETHTLQTRSKNTWTVYFYYLYTTPAGAVKVSSMIYTSLPGDEGTDYLDISSPFILGIFRPRVYLPSGLEGETLQSVLRHEGAHLRRRDHWWKPLGHLLVAVYWFHPLIWAAYVLLCRDIELACDERVVRDMNRAQRAAYSQALLDCAMPRRRRLVLCPLAFGEVGVRDRVKSVLHYRRPGVWLSAAAVLLCAALAMTFLTEPKPARTGVSPETASGQTDPDRLRETSSKALIVATTLDPAAQRISYTVQLTEEPEDWIAQKQWYGVASYADVEIFYPTEGSYYRQTDVPHLRFYEWGLADQPTDLESQRPDTDTRYNDYIVDSVTVLSVDGEQRSTFRRVGQSLLLEEAPHYSGGSVSFHAWLQ